MGDAALILAELRRCAEQVLSLVDNLQDSINVSKEGEQEGLFNNDAYVRFHAFKEEGHRGTPPSKDDWVELERFFRIAIMTIAIYLTLYAF